MKQLAKIRAALITPALLAACMAANGPAEIEAPHIFSQTVTVAWDGNPKNTAVEIRLPNAPPNRRAVVRSGENRIIAALNPAPKPALSAGAAQALGLAANSPVSVQVTALQSTAPPAPDAHKAYLDSAETLDGPAPPAFFDAPPPPEKPVAAKGPYRVRVGSFATKDNAERTLTTLKKQGLNAMITPQTQPTPYWLVSVTGPDKVALLNKLNALGFHDAYAIK